MTKAVLSPPVSVSISTATGSGSALASRFPDNPILRPSDIAPLMDGMRVECLLNPGVFRFNGKIWLLLRVAERPEQKVGKTSFPIINDRGEVEILEFDNDDPLLDRSDARVLRYAGRDYLTTLSHLRLASSVDGVNFTIDNAYKPILGRGVYETYGIEDARVSRIGDEFYITYTAVSPKGVGVGMARTKDWRTIIPEGVIFPPHNKDCAIFEERINGKYYALHRPSSPYLGGNYIWIAESPDLLHWGGHRCIAETRPGLWDSARVGAGAAPIRTRRGWLEIYHGATADHTYCLGALLLDINEPWKVLSRSRNPILVPSTEYETNGFFGKVVFTNGHVVDGDKLTVYYGASDSVICGVNFSIEAILDTLR